MLRQLLAALLAFPFLLLSSAHESRAANLLTNSGFDKDITAWNISGNCFAPAWDSFGPGFTDGALTMNCIGDSMLGKVRQCLAISPTDVDFSAEVSDDGKPGPVAFGLFGFTTDDCTNAPTIVVDPIDTSVTPIAGCCGIAWSTFARANISLPTDTRSLLVEITVTTPADIALDNIQLGPSVFQNGFEVKP